MFAAFSPHSDGALKPSRLSHMENQRVAFFYTPTDTRVFALGLAIATGIAYFAAACLGLMLRAEPGVAIFWPAAGIAVGALLALGARARLPVAAAVLVATIACNLMIARSPWLAVAFGLINAAQALLTAWLIERWFGDAFKLEGVSEVLGFLGASAVGAAVAAAGAAAAISFFQATGSSLNVWRLWFASCLLGIFTVAPLLVGLGKAVRELPMRRELVEGTAGVMTLAVMSVFLILLPQGPWETALPMALVFPILLWVAVRCRPVFAAAAAFVVALAIIWSTTFSVGHFGDASVPLAHRVVAAQTLVLVGALLTLILAALFADRRRSEAELKQSAERLQLALDGAQLGAFRVDLATGHLDCDARAARIHGHDAADITLKEARRFVRHDDLMRIDTALAEAQRNSGNWKAEYRVVLPPEHPHAGQVRWVAFDGSIVRNVKGKPTGLLGVTRDITQNKQAERALEERNVQRALAGKAALVGNYTYDTDAAKMRVDEGYAAIHGFPEGTTEITRHEWLAGLHPDDVEQMKALQNQAFQQRRGELNVEYRIVRCGSEVRWIDARSLITYDNDARPCRLVGVDIDVTERKRAEEHQRTLSAELSHRVKNVLATVSAIVTQTQEASSSHAEFVAALNQRLDSLGRTHELLSRNNWLGVPLAEIVRREFAPYAAKKALFGGPSLTLRAEATQAVAMVLHELTTNAVKYGAFSKPQGRVSVRWWWLQNGSHDRLAIEWREIGGPPVPLPSQTGYGTSIIRELIPFELGGAVDLAHAADGVKCRLEIPADWVSRSHRPTDAWTGVASV
jgi:PAS domain S-box-containing protein